MIMDTNQTQSANFETMRIQIIPRRHIEYNCSGGKPENDKVGLTVNSGIKRWSSTNSGIIAGSNIRVNSEAHCNVLPIIVVESKV